MPRKKDRKHQHNSTSKEKHSEDYYKLEDDYKRAVADYQNLSRRYEEEKKKIIKRANEEVVAKLIEVLDDFEQANKHIKDEGVAGVFKKLSTVVKREGLVAFGQKGDTFDPNLHEAIESSPGKTGKIVEVLRKGYQLGDKVLRPAIVIVGKEEQCPKS